MSTVIPTYKAAQDLLKDENLLAWTGSKSCS